MIKYLDKQSIRAWLSGVMESEKSLLKLEKYPETILMRKAKIQLLEDLIEKCV